jgi:hypothetical protein
MTITRTGHRTETLPVTALDGRPLTLVHVEGARRPRRGPVVLVHGTSVRAELFRPPTDQTLVDALLEAGWDVWLLNWRASIDLDPVPYTLDEAAAYDHPAAVRAIAEYTNADRLKAVVHCAGSMSFTMAAVAGLLPEVDTIVSNGASLHISVPAWSRIKIRTVLPKLRRLTPYLSPAWGNHAEGMLARALVRTVRVTHPECHNTVCRMVSFLYGTGWPALWSHRNLNDATHDWLRGEFGEAPMSFFEQAARCIEAGHVVPMNELPGLPRSYVEGPPRTDARFALITGAENGCWSPESQRRTHAFLTASRPKAGDTLHVFPGYKHIDVLIGKNAARDVYPTILRELAR